jgi:hypothetical protein
METRQRKWKPVREKQTCQRNVNPLQNTQFQEQKPTFRDANYATRTMTCIDEPVNKDVHVELLWCDETFAVDGFNFDRHRRNSQATTPVKYETDER